MTSNNIPFINPQFPDASLLAEDFEQIKTNNWYTNFGPYEVKFKDAIEKFVGQSVQAATFNNATSALLAALITMFGKGDDTKYIVVPSFTFVAGPQAIVWCGYKPLFLDIDTQTLQMSASAFNKLSKTIKKNVVGVLFCNTFGVGDPSIDTWVDLCKKEGLPLIIDSAAGFGSLYADGTYLGARGDCEIFSFHATKPFSIGEGGAITSRNKTFIKKVYALQNFGFEEPRDASVLGFNGKLQEVNAAIGLRQMDGFEKRLASRRSTAEQYKHALQKKGYTFQENAERSSVCFFNALAKTPEHKAEVLERLLENGIQARDYYNPVVHVQAYFKYAHAPVTKLPYTEDIASRIISLPVHDNMPKTMLQMIADLC